MGFGVWDLGFGVWGLGFRVNGEELGTWTDVSECSDDSDIDEGEHAVSEVMAAAATTGAAAEGDGLL